MKGSLGFNGDLSLTHIPAAKPASARAVRVPGGRVIFTRDKGQSKMTGRDVMASSLRLIHRGADGEIKAVRDTGSGLVTNAGVNLMANDFSWAAGATLKQMNFHAIGTGTTAAALTDVFLQTPQGATNLSGTTNGYMTGTQSYVGPNTYKTVATFTATGAISVTEWILTMSSAASLTAQTATSTSTTSLTNTGATFTTAGNGLQGFTVEANTAIINTPTTTTMGQIVSNTGTVLTLLGGWLTLANAGASTPSGTTAYSVFPTAWDHKVFGVVTLASGDSLQAVYSLTINAGG